MRKTSAYARTSNNRYQSVKLRQRNIFEDTKVFKRTWNAHHEHMNELRSSDDYRKLTQAQRFALSELYSAAMDDLHFNHLSWALGREDGTILVVGPGGTWTEEVSELCRIPGALFGAHVWAGTSSLFGEWKATN